jgi:CHAT domain-containing protein
MVEELLAALRKPDRTVEPGPLRELLVSPLGLREDVRSVVVVPVGALNEIPFAALMPDRDVAYAPSGTVLLHLGEAPQAPDAGVLALGDPDYGAASARSSAATRRVGTLPSLPSTALEVRRVAAGPQDVRLLAGEATEEGLRTALGSRPRWHALHLACHGLVDSDRPALSSLALTPSGLDDGHLTALEIGSLRVSADLVVLSACETSRGKLEAWEGIVGLTRSFMLAGAPRVICSLWPVDDEATQALMTRFYELWNPRGGAAASGTLSEPDAPRASGESKGLPTAQALRRAQDFVRSHEKWKHPHYWAAWVLWGVPR